MNEKLSLQNLADALAQKESVSKKAADAFSKGFFDTIAEALSEGEDTVKVKGLGTFRLVTVESRESVNVTNGERFVIPGYRKVAFTPEEGVVSALNQKEGEEDAAPREVRPEEATLVDTSQGEGALEEDVAREETFLEETTLEALIAVPDPVRVERPLDAFAGIDMLISTPESVEEVRQQYEDAKAKMEMAVEEARKANAEKVRLERLLERLEQHLEPEGFEEASGADSLQEGCAAPCVDMDGERPKAALAEKSTPVSEEAKPAVSPAAAPVASASASGDAPALSDEEKRQEAFKRIMGEKPRLVEAEPAEGKSGGRVWLYVLIGLFLAVIAFFIYRTFINIEAVEDVPRVEQKPTVPKKATTPKATVPQQAKDSLAKVQQTGDSVRKSDAPKDSLKNGSKSAEAARPATSAPTAGASVPSAAQPTKGEKPARPTTHIMRRGESLTRISQMYYGTKDSVRALIRVNAFKDPDNVPVGATVKLP